MNAYAGMWCANANRHSCVSAKWDTLEPLKTFVNFMFSVAMLDFTAFSASNDLFEASMAKFQEKVVDPGKFSRVPRNATL